MCLIKTKTIQEKENFVKITWYTHLKCKQRMMYLIYVLNNLSRSLSLSLSLSLTSVSFTFIYIGPNCGLPSLYTSCIHDYNTHMFSCRSSFYLNYKSNFFIHRVVVCCCKIFSIVQHVFVQTSN